MMKSNRNVRANLRYGILSTRKNAIRRNTELLAFVLPALIAIMTFVGIPFVKCVYYSFQNWNGISKITTFIGFDNYVRLFTNDPIFTGSVSYTLIYAVGVVILTNGLALLLAVIIEDTAAGKGFFRTVFYIPNVISLIVIGFVWKFIFSRVFDGLYEATQCGVFALSWLGDRHLAVICTILVSVWQSLGFYLIIYVAGLQTVPPEMHEAAMIDGAGTIRRFFSVTLPLIVPSITFCLFQSTSNSLKMFELIFSLTGGGPGTATTPVALNIYNTAFNNNQYGYGSAKSVILFLLVAIITLTQVKSLKQKEQRL